jgi:hypothetical protein
MDRIRAGFSSYKKGESILSRRQVSDEDNDEIEELVALAII